jgi:Tfp pilus assembly protein PilF
MMGSPMAATPVQQGGGTGKYLGFGQKKASPTPGPGISSLITEPPTRTERFWNTLTGANKPKKPAPTKPDTLSLQTPTEGPSPKTCRMMAQLAELQGDVPAARQRLGEALSLDPKDVVTLREIGHLEDRQGQLDVAEQMYRRAAAVAPTNAALLNDLAICCARQGKLNESANLLSSAIRLSPEKTLYRNNIAKVLVEMGQKDAALKQLAAGHPPASAQFNMGQLLLAKGDDAGASQCFSQALAIAPGMTAASDALASLRAKPSESSLQVAAAPRQRPIDPAPTSAQPVDVEQEDAITPREPAAERVVEGPGFPRLLPPVRN